MRKFGKIVGSAFVVVLAACSSSGSSSSSDGQFIDGFNPPPVKAGDVRIVSPVYKQIPAGKDILYCTYLPDTLSADGKDIDVIATIGTLSKSGHHAVLYNVDDQGTVGDTHVCTDNDMIRARIIGGVEGQPQAFTVPDGIGIPVKAGSHLLLQTHWINTTNKPYDAQAVFDVTAKPHDGSRKPAQGIQVYSSNFNVAAHAPGHVVTDCHIQQDLSLFLLAGHMHQWGSHIKIEKITADGNSQSLIDSPWQPEYQANPPRNSYGTGAPLTFAKGDTFRVTCDFMNTTDNALTFPTEMCVGFGMYFPASNDIDCGDGQWAGGDQGSPE